MASHSVPYQTRMLATMDLERNHIIFSLQHPLPQYLPSGSHFKYLDVSLDLTSVPPPDKINFHGKVGEMLYSKLNRNIIFIKKSENMLQKDAPRLNQEKSNSRALHMQNEKFKDLLMKLGVNPEDKIAFEALLQSSQT